MQRDAASRCVSSFRSISLFFDILGVTGIHRQTTSQLRGLLFKGLVRPLQSASLPHRHPLSSFVSFGSPGRLTTLRRKNTEGPGPNPGRDPSNVRWNRMTCHLMCVNGFFVGHYCGKMASRGRVGLRFGSGCVGLQDAEKAIAHTGAGALFLCVTSVLGYFGVLFLRL